MIKKEVLSISQCFFFLLRFAAALFTHSRNLLLVSKNKTGDGGWLNEKQMNENRTFFWGRERRRKRMRTAWFWLFIIHFSLEWKRIHYNDSIGSLRSRRRALSRRTSLMCLIRSFRLSESRSPEACRKLARWTCALRRSATCSDRVRHGRDLSTRSTCRRTPRDKLQRGRRLTIATAF